MNVLHTVRGNRLPSDSYVRKSALGQVFQGGFNVMVLGGKEEEERRKRGGRMEGGRMEGWKEKEENKEGERMEGAVRRKNEPVYPY